MADFRPIVGLLLSYPMLLLLYYASLKNRTLVSSYTSCTASIVLWRRHLSKNPDISCCQCLKIFIVYLLLSHFAEKAMAPHSSTLAWKILCSEEPGRLQSMGWIRVGEVCATSLSLFTFMYWRRKWQPTPVFLPRESQGQGSLVGFRLWGRTDSDTTEATFQQQSHLDKSYL